MTPLNVIPGTWHFGTDVWMEAVRIKNGKPLCVWLAHVVHLLDKIILHIY